MPASAVHSSRESESEAGQRVFQMAGGLPGGSLGTPAGLARSSRWRESKAQSLLAALARSKVGDGSIRLLSLVAELARLKMWRRIHELLRP